MPLRLKWPNDIYAEVDEEVENDDGRKENAKVLKKVGGVLVNSSFLKGEFLLVTGNCSVGPFFVFNIYSSVILICLSFHANHIFTITLSLY